MLPFAIQISGLRQSLDIFKPFGPKGEFPQESWGRAILTRGPKGFPGELGGLELWALEPGIVGAQEITSGGNLEILGTGMAPIGCSGKAPMLGNRAWKGGRKVTAGFGGPQRL